MSDNWFERPEGQISRKHINGSDGQALICFEGQALTDGMTSVAIVINGLPTLSICRYQHAGVSL